MRDLKSLVEHGILSKSLAIRYLNTYVADIDWGHHIDILYGRLMRDFRDQDMAREAIKKIIACTILLPFVEGAHHIDAKDPARLLHTCKAYRQFGERDQFGLFCNIAKHDLEIAERRKKALGLGYVDPLEYQPLCREAFNRLYNASDEAGYIDTPSHKDKIVKLWKKLVWIYGGTVITKVFTGQEKSLNKILNWRTGYFFEHVIFDTYSIDQILKIKHQELNKTNQKLVCKIGARCQVRWPRTAARISVP